MSQTAHSLDSILKEWKRNKEYFRSFESFLHGIAVLLEVIRRHGFGGTDPGYGDPHDGDP